ncbi:tyrosine-type recombinase/integrase [Rothia sp. P7181]|uniref:tyrosine-type recombinase/integrase n=1 Tax=Rothia sp. P7181 TaxID=3402663 RepID=UPI003AE57578
MPVRKRPKYAPRPVENIQLAKILKNSAKNTRVMVLLAALCGLRVHKIAKIRGSDLDLEKRTPAVIGKGNKRSIIPLHEIIVDTAQSMPESGWWFPSLSDVDKPISGKSCGQAISRAMRRAGVEGTAHQLRHSYGTALLESGEVDLRTLQELMRHESLATTQIYTRVTSERWREAIDNLCLPIVV